MRLVLFTQQPNSFSSESFSVKIWIYRMVHCLHSGPWVWTLNACSFDRGISRKIRLVVYAEIPGVAGGWYMFILGGLLMVSTAVPCPGHLWSSSFSQHLEPNCHVKFLRFLWLSAGGKHFTQRPGQVQCVGGDLSLHCWLTCGYRSWNRDPQVHVGTRLQDWLWNGKLAEFLWASPLAGQTLGQAAFLLWASWVLICPKEGGPLWFWNSAVA